MITQIKAIIRNNILDRIVPNQYFSQEGEDILVQRILDFKEDGFFIDVGSHHPFLKSNTYLFYRRGWRGINIDPMPGSKILFDKFRPGDINLEIAVGSGEGTMKYFSFNKSAYNTTSESVAKDYLNNIPGLIVEREMEVSIHSLESILDKFLPESRAIDFMSIDIEGTELSVLQSNNWKKYRPSLILCEDTDHNILTASDSTITRFLESLGYVFIAKTLNTLFFYLQDHDL